MRGGRHVGVDDVRAGVGGVGAGGAAGAVRRVRPVRRRPGGVGRAAGHAGLDDGGRGRRSLVGRAAGAHAGDAVRAERVVAPTQARVARTVVREAAARFGPMLASMSDVITVADCGRFDEAAAVAARRRRWCCCWSARRRRRRGRRWRGSIGRVRRWTVCSGSTRRVGVVVVGARPYDPRQVADAVGGELFGVLAGGSDRRRSGGGGVDGRAWRVAFAAGSGGPAAGGDAGGALRRRVGGAVRVASETAG